MITQTPPADFPIDENLVKSLINKQFPEFAHLPVRFLAAGWDNENYRLGDQYIIRLPRRAVAAPMVKHEIDCLPLLPAGLPIAVPAPVRAGLPDDGYPWHWSIIPWFEGKNAAQSLPDASEAARLVDFLKKLHAVEQPDFVPENPLRSQPLRMSDERIRIRMERLKSKTPLLTPHIEQLWQDAIDTPFAEKMVLVHGDLHSGNMVVDNGKISAVIDWGDITAGDPAVDMAIFWMLFPDPEVRRRAFERYGADANLVRRATGWAVYYGVVLLDTGWDSNPEHACVGRDLLERLSPVPPEKGSR